MIIKYKLLVIMGLVISAPSFSQINNNSWSIKINENTLLNNKAIILTQTSNIAVRDDRSSENIYPILEFYCEYDNPDIHSLINWKRFISSYNNTEIGVSVDNMKTDWISIKVDKNNNITRLDSNERSSSFIKRLLSGSSLKIQVEPYSEPIIFSQFNLNTFEIKLNELTELCRNQ